MHENKIKPKFYYFKTAVTYCTQLTYFPLLQNHLKQNNFIWLHKFHRINKENKIICGSQLTISNNNFNFFFSIYEESQRNNCSTGTHCKVSHVLVKVSVCNTSMMLHPTKILHIVYIVYILIYRVHILVNLTSLINYICS